MRLGDFIKETELLSSYLPNEELEIDFITNDSRQITKNSLYIAIPGSHWDGHNFLQDVSKRGAQAAIVERIDRTVPLSQYQVRNARQAWSQLSAAYYQHPSREMFVYGITATNGKTTISFMLDEILRAQGLNTGLIGTVKIRTGRSVKAAEMTTPESFELQGCFSEMRNAGVDTVTMEVSSSALEQYRAADVEFDVVSFNNFSREHIDQHGSLEAYWEAKSSLITKARPESIAILNLSDPAIRTLNGKSPAQILTYSLDGTEGDIYPRDIDTSGEYPAFTLVVARDLVLSAFGNRVIRAQEFRVQLATPGRHTIYNAVACCAMALCQGIPGETIARGLAAFHGVERRFEQIYDGDFKIIDDHFANTSNIDASLLSLSGLTYRRLIMVYCIRGSRGTTVNRENVETLARWLPRLTLSEIIVTEARGDVTAHDKVLPEERAVFREAIQKTGLAVTEAPTLDEALKLALERVGPGDILLLAGTQGMDKAGRRILEFISEAQPERRAAILAPMADRVCG